MIVDANEGTYVSSEETFDATIMDISYVKTEIHLNLDVNKIECRSWVESLCLKCLIKVLRWLTGGALEARFSNQSNHGKYICEVVPRSMQLFWSGCKVKKGWRFSLGLVKAKTNQ
jgi:hypothetical protein